MDMFYQDWYSIAKTFLLRLNVQADFVKFIDKRLLAAENKYFGFGKKCFILKTGTDDAIDVNMQKIN